MQEAEARARNSVGAARESGTGENIGASDGIITFGKHPSKEAISIAVNSQVHR